VDARRKSGKEKNRIWNSGNQEWDKFYNAGKHPPSRGYVGHGKTGKQSRGCGMELRKSGTYKIIRKRERMRMSF